MSSDDALNGFDENGDDRPPELYRLELGGEWGLWEFSGFGRQYVQSYSLYHALMAADQGDELSWYRLRGAISAYPWRGGWSSVDFFGNVISMVPRKHLPRIRRIQYASPGFIEITIGIILAAQAVKSVSKAYDKLHDSYVRTQRALRETKLMDMNVKKAELDVRQREMVMGLAESFRDDLEMRRFERLFRSMDIHPLAELKMFLALCRRIKPLSKLQKDDNIRF